MSAVPALPESTRRQIQNVVELGERVHQCRYGRSGLDRIAAQRQPMLDPDRRCAQTPDRRSCREDYVGENQGPSSAFAPGRGVVGNSRTDVGRAQPGLAARSKRCSEREEQNATEGTPGGIAADAGCARALQRSEVEVAEKRHSHRGVSPRWQRWSRRIGDVALMWTERAGDRVRYPPRRRGHAWSAEGARGERAGRRTVGSSLALQRTSSVRQIRHQWSLRIQPAEMRGRALQERTSAGGDQDILARRRRGLEQYQRVRRLPVV